MWSGSLHFLSLGMRCCTEKGWRIFFNSAKGSKMLKFVSKSSWYRSCTVHILKIEYKPQQAVLVEYGPK